MGLRPVVRYPDPILKRVAEPAGEITDALRALADDLVRTMREGPATVGLAAPQIGEPVRAFVLDVSTHKKAETSHGLVVLFDPELLEAHESDVMREGCLSVPDLTADVRRAVRCVVRGTGPEGAERVYRMEGFEARALQHELDHLDGTLILDRVTSPSEIFPRKVYR